ncbi:hypothetical protein [uncultured Lutibacter sp.]|uniref:hypothetical protein n=1 Tax=uncultured Lutibacter sp. TaxID=437739 RepID=UPI00261BB32C|nr:hypothetical protein [uncultured Lutibacter sp.]
MKIFTIIVVSFLTLNFQTPLESARQDFPNIMSLEQAKEHISLLESDDSPEAIGYTAAMILMKSRYVKGPFAKLKYFKQGKKLLDQDIVENPTSIEIRYIRFLMQKQIPDFLGYNKNIEEDFNIIFDKILNSNLSSSFKNKMLNTMLLVDDLTEIEKNKINQILDKL